MSQLFTVLITSVKMAEDIVADMKGDILCNSSSEGVDYAAADVKAKKSKETFNCPRAAASVDDTAANFKTEERGSLRNSSSNNVDVC